MTESETQTPIRLYLFLLSLAINFVVLAGIWASNPEYLRDHKLAGKKDGNGYVQIGTSLILYGQYSRHDRAPFVPNVHRPPVYPIFSGGLNLIFGSAGIYVAQAILLALSCVLIYDVGCMCFSKRTGLCAAVGLSVDLVVVTGVFVPLTEIAFIALLLAGLRLILVPLTTDGCDSKRALTCAAIGGLLFGLSILTRPAGLYLPMLVAIALLAVSLRKRNILQVIAIPALFCMMTYLPVSAWILRNQAVFNLARLTTTDAQMTVYYLGTAAYQIQHDASRSEAHAMIRDEFDLPSHHEIHNVDFVGGDIRELYLQVKGAAKPVLRKYPLATLRAGASGVMNAFKAHTGGSYARALNARWSGYGDDSTSGGNDALIIGLVAWQVLLHAAVIFLAIAGVASMIMRPGAYSAGAWLLLLMTGYFCAIPAMGAFVSSSRAALPAWPLLILFGSHGLDRLSRGRK